MKLLSQDTKNHIVANSRHLHFLFETQLNGMGRNEGLHISPWNL